MSLLGGMSAASSAFSSAGSLASIAEATGTLINGPLSTPGITGPNYSVDKSVFSVLQNPLSLVESNANISFLFDVNLNDNVQLSAQITDHYTEVNSAIQDHVAIEPIKITMTGIVSEVMFERNKYEKYIQEILNNLGNLNILSPSMSNSAQLYLNSYNQLQSSYENTLKQVNGALASFKLGSGDTRNKQQLAYQQFEDWFKKKEILSVETPWKTFTKDTNGSGGMIIESLSFDQDETTKDQSTITITFKEIRRISTISGVGPLKGRIKAQAASTSDKGPSKGTEVPTTVAADAADKLFGK